MIISSQRGKMCLLYGHTVGDLPCEECDHFVQEPSGHTNEHGVEGTNEYCSLIVEAEAG